MAQHAQCHSANDVDTLVDAAVGFEQCVAMIALDIAVTKREQSFASVQRFVATGTGKHKQPHFFETNFAGILTGNITA